MNFIKKLLKDDDDEIYDDKYKDDYTGQKGGVDNSRLDIGDMSEIIDDIPPAGAEPASREGVGVKGGAGAVSLRVMKPKSYDDGPEIADFVAGGCTVVMNIEDLSRESARRLIDFLLGAVHVIGGDLQMASQNTFVVAPSTVGVGGDEDENDEFDSPAGYAGLSDFIVGDRAAGTQAASGFGFNK